jgi:hypothetical protein
LKVAFERLLLLLPLPLEPGDVDVALERLLLTAILRVFALPGVLSFFVMSDLSAAPNDVFDEDTGEDAPLLLLLLPAPLLLSFGSKLDCNEDDNDDRGDWRGALFLFLLPALLLAPAARRIRMLRRCVRMLH